MTRLTNYIREAICLDVLAHRFKQPVLDLLAVADQLGQDIYAYLYPPEILAQMQALPESFFRRQNHINIYVLDERPNLYFGPYIEYLKGYHSVTMQNHEVPNRIIAERDYPTYNNMLSLTPDLKKRAEILIQERNRHNAAYNTAETQIHAALAAVGTVKRLIEAWPEVEPFAAKWLEDSPKKPQLPAIPVASLNAMLDLPIDSAA